MKSKVNKTGQGFQRSRRRCRNWNIFSLFYLNQLIDIKIVVDLCGNWSLNWSLKLLYAFIANEIIALGVRVLTTARIHDIQNSGWVNEGTISDTATVSARLSLMMSQWDLSIIFLIFFIFITHSVIFTVS